MENSMGRGCHLDSGSRWSTCSTKYCTSEWYRHRRRVNPVGMFPGLVPAIGVHGLPGQSIIITLLNNDRVLLVKMNPPNQGCRLADTYNLPREIVVRRLLAHHFPGEVRCHEVQSPCLPRDGLPILVNTSRLIENRTVGRNFSLRTRTGEKRNLVPSLTHVETELISRVNHTFSKVHSVRLNAVSTQVCDWRLNRCKLDSTTATSSPLYFRILEAVGKRADKPASPSQNQGAPSAK